MEDRFTNRFDENQALVIVCNIINNPAEIQI